MSAGSEMGTHAGLEAEQTKSHWQPGPHHCDDWLRGWEQPGQRDSATEKLSAQPHPPILDLSHTIHTQRPGFYI